MDLKFWRRKKPVMDTSTGHPVQKVKKIEKPRELPQAIYRYLVVERDLDPNWVWKLKYVRQRRANPLSTFDIRLFDPEAAKLAGATVRDYASLDHHPGLVLFTGWYDSELAVVELEHPVDEAV